jgi:hypothetical protein
VFESYKHRLDRFREYEHEVSRQLNTAFRRRIGLNVLDVLRVKGGFAVLEDDGGRRCVMFVEDQEVL